MEENFYLSIINNQKKEEILKIKKCNEYTNKYGLILTENQINNIIEKRFNALKETQRIEFGEWIIDKIINKFCDSPYMQKDNYAETIYELIDIFYYYKNETQDLITDDELLDYMKKYFDGICQGDIEYLSGTILDRIANNLINGRDAEYMVIPESDEGYGIYE